LPSPGEEVLARELRATPGGTAIQAIGAARLGLRAAVVAPVPTDALGALLVSMLRSEDVAWVGGEGDATSVTALLPGLGGVAMASAIGTSDPSADEVAAAGGRAVVASLGRARLVPEDATYYATTGPLEVAAGFERPEAAISRARAVIVNEREANALTGRRGADAVEAILALGAASAVVTLGTRGAVAGDGRTIEETPAARGFDGVDATGAGDLFTAAYVWADLAGLALAGRMSWASLAAGLSIRAPTALDGAVRLEELRAEGERRGLEPPA
jgi:sugar/nucleoside kinase (ribokinase family)